ncbi:hypothetical protein Bbelb_291720 [Branchiostoma belcheri]|nr:hypothetical protein Bbelb_291720 [Branchiostoma belcheri]
MEIPALRKERRTMSDGRSSQDAMSHSRMVGVGWRFSVAMFGQLYGPVHHPLVPVDLHPVHQSLVHSHVKRLENTGQSAGNHRCDQFHRARNPGSWRTGLTWQNPRQGVAMSRLAGREMWLEVHVEWGYFLPSAVTAHTEQLYQQFYQQFCSGKSVDCNCPRLESSTESSSPATLQQLYQQFCQQFCSGKSRRL